MLNKIEFFNLKGIEVVLSGIELPDDATITVLDVDPDLDHIKVVVYYYGVGKFSKIFKSDETIEHLKESVSLMVKTMIYFKEHETETN